MRDLDELTAITADAIQLAHDMLNGATPTGIRTKMDRDFVTDVDLQIERELRTHLAHITPEAGFLGEEEGHTGSTETYWTVDPIDGTTNFIHGLPLYAASLAFINQSQTLTAAIDAPALGVRYTATKRHGAYCNGEPIHASSTADPTQAVVAIGDYATGMSAAEKNVHRLRLTTALAERVERIRMLGTAALDLALVAHGHLDASITLSNKTWDMAPGVLIAREAGATATDQQGLPHSLQSGQTLCGNSQLIAALLNVITAPNAAKPIR